MPLRLDGVNRKRYFIDGARAGLRLRGDSTARDDLPQPLLSKEGNQATCAPLERHTDFAIAGIIPPAEHPLSPRQQE